MFYFLARIKIRWPLTKASVSKAQYLINTAGEKDIPAKCFQRFLDWFSNMWPSTVMENLTISRGLFWSYLLYLWSNRFTVVDSLEHWKFDYVLAAPSNSPKHRPKLSFHNYSFLQSMFMVNLHQPMTFWA